MNKDQKSQYEIEKLLKENEALKAEKALSQMRNETRSMLSESGVENFDASNCRHNRKTLI